MITHYKEEIIKKGTTVKTSTLVMVAFILVTLLTGIATLYYKSIDVESTLYSTFGIIHRLSGFASLCFIGYHMPAVAPWFLSKTSNKLENRGILILIMSILLLALMVTIIFFNLDTHTKQWFFIHSNAGIGFFVSVIFYLMLYNNK